MNTNISNPTIEDLQMEMSLLRLKAQIQELEKEFDTVQGEINNTLGEIAASGNSVGSPAQQEKLKALSEKELRIARNLDSLKFAYAVSKPGPHIPHREPEELDIERVMDSYQKEKDALREIKEARERAESRDIDRSIDR